MFQLPVQIPKCTDMRSSQIVDHFLHNFKLLPVVIVLCALDAPHMSWSLWASSIHLLYTLGWAIGQLRKKEADSTFVLSAVWTHCWINILGLTTYWNTLVTYQLLLSVFIGCQSEYIQVWIHVNLLNLLEFLFSILCKLLSPSTLKYTRKLVSLVQKMKMHDNQAWKY
jgi:hypothetical protein